MRILLVFPKSFEPNALPPLGIAILGSCLRRAGYDVVIWDQTVEPDRQLDWSSYSILGMTLLCATFHHGVALARRIREVNSNVLVVAGGPFADTRPREVLESGCIDVVVHGEGEETFLLIADAVRNKNRFDTIRGLSFYLDGGVVNTGMPLPIRNLDTIPLPAYDLLPLKKYFRGSVNNGKLEISIMGSRGCSFQCVYCSRGPSEYKVVRYHSAERILEWAEMLVVRFGCELIRFVDSTFTLDQARAEHICDLLIERNLPVEWSCLTRIDCLNPRLLEKMKTAGCSSILLGIESGNEDILSKAKKGFTKEKVLNLAQIFADVKGPQLCAAFIIGHPWDTRKTIKETVEFAKDLRKKYGIQCVFFLMIPFPGTELWEHAKELGMEIGMNWQEFCKTSFKGDVSKVSAVFATRFFSREELEKEYYMAIRHYRGLISRLDPFVDFLRHFPLLYRSVRNILTTLYRLK